MFTKADADRFIQQISTTIISQSAIHVLLSCSSYNEMDTLQMSQPRAPTFFRFECLTSQLEAIFEEEEEEEKKRQTDIEEQWLCVLCSADCIYSPIFNGLCKGKTPFFMVISFIQQSEHTSRSRALWRGNALIQMANLNSKQSKFQR